MPLQIIRQDITKIECDAVVNPTNVFLEPDGGTDLAIHQAAGPELYEFCKTLEMCDTGHAKISPAFRLPCKYVIHTVGPKWEIDENAETLLVSCYNECLKIAHKNNCESIAFPLISSGLYGFPKDKVLKIAINTISSFLFDNEMMIYLVVFDKKAYEFSQKIFTDIKEYIDDRYYLAHSDNAEDIDYILNNAELQQNEKSDSVSEKSKNSKSIEDYIRLDKKFAYKLYDLIELKNMSTVECYKKANVSKQTWHKIETDKTYKPNKKTVISFAIALRLTIEETQMLLKTVGFVLSESNLFDVIIMYCIENSIYDVFEIDSILFKYDQETLFSKA